MSEELINVKEGAKLTKRSVEAYRKWTKRNKIQRVPNQGRKVLHYRSDILRALGLESIQQLQSLGSLSRSA